MIVMIFIEKNFRKNQNVLTPRGSILEMRLLIYVRYTSSCIFRLYFCAPLIYKLLTEMSVTIITDRCT